jgi:hypothetical protein
MVAIELAAPSSPFKKSNSGTMAIRPTKMERPSVVSTTQALPYTCSITMLLISLATSSKRFGDRFQVIVDFRLQRPA